MKLSTAMRITAGTLLLGCTGTNPQALIDQWNADFGAQKQACESGNPSACQIACQMSLYPQVCDTVKARADLNDPQQRTWVEQCSATAARQGLSVCAAAGVPAAPPPVETRIPIGTPPAPTPAPTPTPAPERSDIPADLQAQMRNMLNELEAKQKVGDESGTNDGTATPSAQVAPEAENAVVQGSLPKPVIRRVINGHQARLRQCYETRLAAAPNLSGRVVTKFVISGTGAVQLVAISESTLGDPAVESCVSQVFRRMVFPAPEGGGIVVVTYPLLFTKAGTP